MLYKLLFCVFSGAALVLWCWRMQALAWSFDVKPAVNRQQWLPPENSKSIPALEQPCFLSKLFAQRSCVACAPAAAPATRRHPGCLGLFLGVSGCLGLF